MLRVLALSGGALRGIFQLPIVRHLWANNTYDLVLGVSAGAINGSLVAQGRLDELEAFWRGIDTKNALLGGVPDFMGPSMLEPATPKHLWGAFTLAPLRRTLGREFKRQRLTVPFGAGVTLREDFSYRTILAGPGADAVGTGDPGWRHEVVSNPGANRRMRDAICASGAQVTIHQPWRVRLGDRDYWGSDGGHRYVVPKVPRTATVIDAVQCAPVEPSTQNVEQFDTLLDSVAWNIECSLVQTHKIDLDRLKGLAAGGAQVRLYAPRHPLRSSWDGSRETMDWRWAEGEWALAHPTQL